MCSNKFLNNLDAFYNNALLLGETCIEYNGLLLSKSLEDRWVLAGVIWDKETLKTLHLPDFIEEIGEDALSNYGNLTDIVLPKGLKVINDGAFMGCSNIRDIRFPDTLEEIGYGAFFYSGITSIYLPDSVKRLGVCAFNLSRKVSSLSIPCGIRLGSLCFSMLGIACRKHAITFEIRPLPNDKDNSLERQIGPYAVADYAPMELSAFYESAAYVEQIKVIDNMFIVKK